MHFFDLHQLSFSILKAKCLRHVVVTTLSSFHISQAIYHMFCELIVYKLKCYDTLSLAYLKFLLFIAKQ